MDEPSQDADRIGNTHELTPRQADFFVIGWASFLAACFGTMLLFAFVDPLMLAEVTEPPLPVSRMTGYALGFFFLWALCLISGALCVYLVRTRHEQSRPQTDQT
ncbi:MAG: hypothetical protein PVF63_08310 [Gammaproteobacteria bacterium]|jgi:hypothetical protein